MQQPETATEKKMELIAEMERVMGKSKPTVKVCLTVTPQEHDIILEALGAYRALLQMGGEW